MFVWWQGIKPCFPRFTLRSHPAANPASGRVFLPRLLRETLPSFPRGKPLGAPASPSTDSASLHGLTPFPQSCHGFVLAPSSRQKPRHPQCVVKSSGVGGAHSSRGGPPSGACIPVLRNAAGSTTFRPAARSAPATCRQHYGVPSPLPFTPGRISSPRLDSEASERQPLRGPAFGLPCRGQGIFSKLWKNPSRIFQCSES